MSEERATDYIKAFHLTEREEICIMEKEVHDLSYVQICRKYGFSPEMVKTTRKRAFAKMVDAIEYRKAPGLIPGVLLLFGLILFLSAFHVFDKVDDLLGAPSRALKRFNQPIVLLHVH
jgi:DNA-binding CsgD family transcriptional regulator